MCVFVGCAYGRMHMGGQTCAADTHVHNGCVAWHYSCRVCFGAPRFRHTLAGVAVDVIGNKDESGLALEALAVHSVRDAGLRAQHILTGHGVADLRARCVVCRCGSVRGCACVYMLAGACVRAQAKRARESRYT